MKIHTITLPGRVPSKKNSKRRIQRGGKIFMVPSESHEAWHAEMMRETRKQWREKTLEKVKSIKITFTAADKRKADNSNKAESVMDLLVDAGVLADDNWFVVPELNLVFAGVDKEKPQACIMITTL